MKTPGVLAAAPGRKNIIFFAWILVLSTFFNLSSLVAQAASEHSGNSGHHHHRHDPHNFNHHGEQHDVRDIQASNHTNSFHEESNEDMNSFHEIHSNVKPTVTMATLRRVWRRGEEDSIQALLADLANLQHGQSQPSHQSDPSSYLPARFLRRHYGLWLLPRSPTAVLPKVAAWMIWSAVVFHVLHRNPILLGWVEEHASFFTGGLMSSLTVPMSLLLVLQTNQAWNRFLKVRSSWAAMVRAGTSLAGLAATYLVDENKALLMGRYLAVWGWTLSGFCDDPTILQTVLPPEEAAWLLQRAPADTPTSILFRLRQIIAESCSDLPPVAWNAMEDRLAELEGVLGTCKQEGSWESPIPAAYARHTSRVLCLYLSLLPIALMVGSASTPGMLAMLIPVALWSFVFVGMEESGAEHSLPIGFIAKTLQENVSHQFIMSSQQGHNYRTSSSNPRSESSR